MPSKILVFSAEVADRLGVPYEWVKAYRRAWLLKEGVGSLSDVAAQPEARARLMAHLDAATLEELQRLWLEGGALLVGVTIH